METSSMSTDAVVFNNTCIEVTCESVLGFFCINMLKQKEQSLFHLSNVTPKGRAGDKVIYGSTV